MMWSPHEGPGNFFEPRSNFNYSWQFEQRIYRMPSLRELFLTSNMGMPDFIGFVNRTLIFTSHFV